MRKVIARRLTEAKQTIPHFYLTRRHRARRAAGACAPQLNGRAGARLQALGQRLRHQGGGPGACARCPGVNVSWGGDKIYQFKDIDVSVAVAIAGGLITPIVRKADQKGLSTISTEMKDLAGRAKDGKLQARGVSGRRLLDLQSRHVRHQGLRGRHQPAAGLIMAVGAGEKRPGGQGRRARRSRP